MPVHSMALARGEPARLEVRSEHGDTDAWRVLLDGREVGSFATQAEAIAGATFTLDDGSKLTVRLEELPSMLGASFRIRVERDGALLRDSPGHPAHTIRNAASSVWLVAIVSAITGVVTLLSTHDPALRTASIVLGAMLLSLAAAEALLGVAARREHRWALLAGFAIECLALVLALLSLSICGALFRVLAIGAIIRGILAHRQLGRLDAAAVANVFR